MNDHVVHGQRILNITHTVICGRSLEEAEVAFATLCGVDLEAAIHLADLIVLASPGSGPLWQAIIDSASKNQAPNRVDQSGPAMSADDTQDTAGGLAEHMGWLDVEADGKA